MQAKLEKFSSKSDHLLEEDGVVSLKGLENVMIAPPGSKSIAGGIAMPPTALSAG